MIKRKIILSRRNDEVKVAVLENEELVEYYIESEDDISPVGNIFKGRITSIREELKGIFVNIGLDIDGFLPLNDYHYFTNGRKPQIGEYVLVQITKEPYGTKGSRLTMAISIPGRYVVLMPNVKTIGISRKIKDKEEKTRLFQIVKRFLPQKMGIVLRTSSSGVDENIIKKEIQHLYGEWKILKDKFEKLDGVGILRREEELEIKITRDLFIEEYSEMVVDSKHSFRKILLYLREKNVNFKGKLNLYTGEKDIFEHFNIMSEIEKIFRRKVWLKNGGFIVIDQTEAMHVIDVNSGKYSGKKDQKNMIVETNLLAAKEIARQLRLRDIGGIIIVDFIDMPDEKSKNHLLKELKKFLSNDRSKVEVIDITSLGLVEITRKRIRENVSSKFIDACPYCSGKGVVFSQSYLLSLLESWFNKKKENIANSSVSIFLNPAIYNSLKEENILRLSEFVKKMRISLKINQNCSIPVDKIKIIYTIKNKVFEEEI
uniref:Rne/Rng family ribonuclease n=1 Tax=candidate division WOR-3 bacterium TaxID=2052148 RepID=A0A7C4YEN2_UNCW3